ncbi:hypothetical protein C1645_788818 [Glomus cerebriforme]|uniref:Uncharacterized protein n=1 Tax=Glomus cerebriforme TaxID=658196 RepID=A0A397S9N4_9GLOM|nr:hypothetical protein C1645_788818 [Glomus cerebriforme]
MQIIHYFVMPILSFFFFFFFYKHFMMPFIVFFLFLITKCRAYFVTSFIYFLVNNFFLFLYSLSPIQKKKKNFFLKVVLYI